MTITIELRCPRCNDNNLARNGKKRNGVQNYLCNACGRQFIRDDQRTYIGTLPCPGFFVLELKGEAVDLVPPPEGFVPSEW